MSVISTMWNKFGQTTQTSTLGTVGDERGIPPLQKRSLMQNKGGTWGMVAVAALVGGFILWHQWQKQSMVAEKAAAENAKNASKSVASAGNDFRWSDVFQISALRKCVTLAASITDTTQDFLTA